MKEKVIPIIEMWRHDYSVKTFINSSLSLLITAAFALYNEFLGIIRQSLWHGSIAVYYIFLVVIRAIILGKEREYHKKKNDCVSNRRTTFIITSVILLMLSLALSIPISLMVLMKKPVNVGMIPAIAMAAYTTYKIIMASVNLKKRKRSSNILVKELRAINFIDALVSILTLQNTLITVFSGDGAERMLTLTSVTSAAILSAIVVLITVPLIKIIKEKE